MGNKVDPGAVGLNESRPVACYGPRFLYQNKVDGCGVCGSWQRILQLLAEDVGACHHGLHDMHCIARSPYWSMPSAFLNKLPCSLCVVTLTSSRRLEVFTKLHLNNCCSGCCCNRQQHKMHAPAGLDCKQMHAFNAAFWSDGRNNRPC